MPVPPAGFAGLTPEELRALEGHERQHLEARLQSLRNIHTLLDAAMLQINQYLTVLASLGYVRASLRYVRAPGRPRKAPGRGSWSLSCRPVTPVDSGRPVRRHTRISRFSRPVSLAAGGLPGSQED